MAFRSCLTATDIHLKWHVNHFFYSLFVHSMNMQPSYGNLLVWLISFAFCRYQNRITQKPLFSYRTSWLSHPPLLQPLLLWGHNRSKESGRVCNSQLIFSKRCYPRLKYVSMFLDAYELDFPSMMKNQDIRVCFIFFTGIFEDTFNWKSYSANLALSFDRSLYLRQPLGTLLHIILTRCPPWIFYKQ